jgi:hypothetical protein
MATPNPRRGDTVVQTRLVRVRRQAVRSCAFLGTVLETMATQAPGRLPTRSNPMLQSEAVQASSIEARPQRSAHPATWHAPEWCGAAPATWRLCQRGPWCLVKGGRSLGRARRNSLSRQPSGWGAFLSHVGRTLKSESGP